MRDLPLISPHVRGHKEKETTKSLRVLNQKLNLNCIQDREK